MFNSCFVYKIRHKGSGIRVGDIVLGLIYGIAFHSKSLKNSGIGAKISNVGYASAGAAPTINPIFRSCT